MDITNEIIDGINPHCEGGTHETVILNKYILYFEWVNDRQCHTISGGYMTPPEYVVEHNIEIDIIELTDYDGHLVETFYEQGTNENLNVTAWAYVHAPIF